MTLSLVALRFLCCERRRLGGKTPEVSAPQVREVLRRLLRDLLLSPERIAEEDTHAMRRKEAARIYKWHKVTGGFLPRRPPPDSS